MTVRDSATYESVAKDIVRCAVRIDDLMRKGRDPFTGDVTDPKAVRSNLHRMRELTRMGDQLLAARKETG